MWIQRQGEGAGPVQDGRGDAEAEGQDGPEGGAVRLQCQVRQGLCGGQGVRVLRFCCQDEIGSDSNYRSLI